MARCTATIYYYVIMTIHSALLTDLYQLTMAYGYWRLGMAEREAAFHLFFRRHPFGGNYTVCCGLENVIEYLQNWRFNQQDLLYLQTLVDVEGNKLFTYEFLEYLSHLRFNCTVYAVPEGEIIFSQEPMLRVTGPILQCQIIETAIVNAMGFSSLIATKAARVCRAAQGDPVVEFGMRRAQGPDGCMTASRAAFIGGCESVSNTLAAKTYQIPARGTMAHSWIMAFADEYEAFEKYIEVFPGNVVLLVDTYETTFGVENAIAIGKILRNSGHELYGIRLDSGDLNELSKKARQLLDDNDFSQTKIVASGDLDEQIIAQLKKQKAPIDIWGVGTRMTTGWGQPALDAAYKLTAICDEQGTWLNKIKRSNQPQKTTNPGIQQICRYQLKEQWLGDVIYDQNLGIVDHLFPQSNQHRDLLQLIFKDGKLRYQSPSIQEIQQYCKKQLNEFLQSNQEEYSVHLEPRLQSIKDQLLTNIENNCGKKESS